MDASHFIFATFLGYLWCQTRCFLKSHAGRNRYNVLGALNAITKKVSIYTNDTTLGAYSCLLYTSYNQIYCISTHRWLRYLSVLLLQMCIRDRSDMFFQSFNHIHFHGFKKKRVVVVVGIQPFASFCLTDYSQRKRRIDIKLLIK